MSSKFEKYKEQIIDTETRWVTFIGKLKQRTTELCEASREELISVYNNDPDEYKSVYGNMLSAIIEQINSITGKAHSVFEENIYKFFDKLEDKVDENEELSELVSDASDRCSELLETFENWVDEWIKKIKETDSLDLEEQYQAILDEHEQIKNKFCCKQCGSMIPLPEILFLITHLECPSCQTQNTFTPGSKAAGLQHLGRRLAEKRMKHLYEAYQAEEEKQVEIYQQMHKLELSIGFGDSHENAAPVKAQIAELKAKHKQAKKDAPVLLKKYYRAMFDELNRIVPVMKEQNEKVYLRCLKENYLEDIELN